MNVPFSSSGAMSRAHYALVRKIETATPQAADQILLAEVHSIRNQLTRSTLTTKQCKESLVLLLYCFMAVNPGVVIDLQFALPHAINLAEAGKTTQDKRTGYLFCAQVMPPEHELQLMLVNSIRKDMESVAIPRICLALEILIQSPSTDVIPAVQRRLHDLLSHNSLHVRRRALFAFRALAEHDPEILRDVVNKLRKRLADPDALVASAGIALANAALRANHLQADEYHTIVTNLLDAAWSQRPESNQSRLLVKIIEVITQLTPSRHDLEVIVEILQYYAHGGPLTYAIIHQCFRAISASPVETLAEVQTSSGVSPVQEIRHLLTSHDPNAIYVFVCGLSSIDSDLWAGTIPDKHAVLEEWEMERIMKLLESEDKAIRKQTLRTLWRVDHNIVESYFARALQGDLPSASTQGSEGDLLRLLEMIDIICGDDGEVYAHQLKDVLRAQEGDGPLNRRAVLQDAVEEILLRMHVADSSWRGGCVGVMFSSAVDTDSEIGPTLMVILTALLCEYLELSPITPNELLRGISVRVLSYSGSVQDACLITMLRISASCDESSSEVVEVVNDLHAHSGRHIRRRCEQFTNLCQSKETLRRIIASTHTPSLPDFVFALEQYEADQKIAVSRSPSMFPSSPPLKPHTPEPLSSRASPIPGKLRYAAYDAPKPTHRLRRTSSSSSRHSDDDSSRGWPDLARTVTPGDLTLAAQTSDLRSIPSTSPRQTALSALPIVQILDDEPALMPADLIALDSPFTAVPSLSGTASSIVEHDFDFETIWKGLESGAARGWCEASIDTVLRRLQGLQRRLRVTERDRPPFQGDLKIVICPEPASSSKTGLVALHLKESEDDSCLWWLRTEDEQMRNIIKATLR